MKGFPEKAGAYLCSRDNDLILVKIKGIYPTLELDKNTLDVGLFLRQNKVTEAPKEIVDDIQLFPENWDFQIVHVNYSVFSKIEFKPNGDVYVSYEDACSMRDKYYRMCQQGISSIRAMRAISFEFKTSMDRTREIINMWDKEA